MSSGPARPKVLRGASSSSRLCPVSERFQIMEDFVETLHNDALEDELNQALIEKRRIPEIRRGAQAISDTQQAVGSFPRG